MTETIKTPLVLLRALHKRDGLRSSNAADAIGVLRSLTAAVLDAEERGEEVDPVAKTVVNLFKVKDFFGIGSFLDYMDTRDE